VNEKRLAEHVIEPFLQDFHNMYQSGNLLRVREPSVTFQDFRVQNLGDPDDVRPSRFRNTGSFKKEKQGTIDYLSLVVSSTLIDYASHNH
jgi:hypothetical protein